MQPQMDELVCRYLDGTASSEEIHELDQVLRDDAEAARTLLEFSALDTQLRQVILLDRGAEEMADESPRESSLPSFLTEPRSGTSASPSQRESMRAPWWRSGWAAAALAASLLIALIGWRYLVGDTDSRDPLIAEVIDISGDVIVLRKSRPATLALGELINPRDAVRVDGPAGSFVKLEYPDGTVVQLDNRTQVVLLNARGAKSVKLQSGQLAADIASQPEGQEMTFSTRDAEAKVVGTALEFMTQPDETVLNVTEGEVRFTSLVDGTSVTVIANQTAALRNGVFVQPTPGTGRFSVVPAVAKPPVSLVPAAAGPPVMIPLAKQIRYPFGVTHDGWNLWISNGRRIGQELLAAGLRVPLKGEATEKLILFRICPLSGAILEELDLGDSCHEMGASGLAWGGGYLWAADYNAPSKILRINPADGTRTSFDAPVTGTSILTYGDGHLWAMTQQHTRGKDTLGTIFKITPGRVTETDHFELKLDGHHAYGHLSLAYLGDHLWLHAANQDSPGTFYKIRPSDGTILQRYRGSHNNNVVTGMCSDPNGQFWLLDTQGRWLHSIQIDDLRKENAAPLPDQFNESAKSLLPSPSLRTLHSASRNARLAANGHESLTVIRPQLESKNRSHSKPLYSLDLLQGREIPLPLMSANTLHYGHFAASTNSLNH